MTEPFATKEEYLQQVLPIVEGCLGNTRAFSQTFLPHRFTRPFDEPHNDLFNLLDNEDIRRVVVAAPRGTGKTSIAGIAYPARRIVYNEVKFILRVSCTHAMAARHVRQLGKELVENSSIIKVFGPLKGPKWSEGDGDLETVTKVHIVARGAGQQIRGLLEETRPDEVVIDDLEDSEPFRLGDPTEYLRKIKEWFWSDLMNSIDLKVTRVFYVGTVLHEDSLLSNLLDNPEWHPVRQELCDDSFHTNYPNYLKDDEIFALYKSFEKVGQTDLFYREYRNMAIDTSDASFTRKYFKYFNLNDLLQPTKR